MCIRDRNGGIFYGSDYFERCYEYAEQLIKEGKAYVCDLSREEMQEYRGTLTEPGRPSPWRDRSVEENLDLFRRMRAGEFADGSRTLRAKIDMASPNMNIDVYKRQPTMCSACSSTVFWWSSPSLPSSTPPTASP